MNEQLYMEPSGPAGPGMLLGGFFWMVMLAVYVYFAFMQYRMAANKTGNADIAWWAFIPIMNTLLLIKMAGKEMWWFLLLLIPVVNAVSFFILWINAAKNCGQSGVWGFLMMIPFLNFIAAFVLAYGSRSMDYGQPASPSRPRQPQNVG